LLIAFAIAAPARAQETDRTPDDPAGRERARGIFRSSDVFTGVPSADPGDPCYCGSCIRFEDRLGRP
jgi:hypothetical protein